MKPLSFLDDETFSTVFSNQVIEHLTHEAQHNVVREAFRILKLGGQLLIIFPCRHYNPARQDKYHINLLTPTELRELVEKYGFQNSNMGFNRCQQISFIPKILLNLIWKKFRPDIFSQDATVLAYKSVN